MTIQKHKQTSQSHSEVIKDKLDSAHYRKLLGWVYGPGAEDERLWDDSYILEIEQALSTIAERETTIIRARLLGGRLDQVGTLFDCTGERIRQLEGKAIRKLRHPSRSPAIRGLRLRLCQYPKQPLRGPRLPKPKRCIHCGGLENKAVRFPPCSVRVAQLQSQADAPPSEPASA